MSSAERDNLLFVLSLTCTILLTSAVTHERNLIWTQKGEGPQGVARIVGVNGDPNEWVVNRTATTRLITAPNDRWHFVALSFDFSQKVLFWSDRGTKKIQGLRLDGSNVAITVYQGVSNQVEGVAVDWISQNVYWTDRLYNWVMMAPSVPSAEMSRVIVRDGLDEPMGIVVYPQKGYIFWSDWGAVPRIEKASLSGTDRQTIVSTGLDQPTGLAIDYSSDLIYWADRRKGTIEMVTILGTGRQLFKTFKGTQFFGITLYQDYIFLTDQANKQLDIINLKTKKQEVQFTLDSRPYDIIMYDDTMQPKAGVTMPAVCDIAGCEHMCVTDFDGAARCLCSEGFTLNTDGKTCRDDSKYRPPQVIYSIGTAICRFPGNLPDMNLRNVTLDTQCFLTHRRDALALAFDVHAHSIYFSENKTKTIARVRLEAGETPEIIIGGTGTVAGVAMDWIASNLYWTDSSHAHIMIAKQDGRYQRILINGSMNEPRGIAVDAVNRYLYWSDIAGPPRIERSRPDGSGRSVFLDKGLGTPNHLVVDYLTKRLYWTDSKLGRIEYIGLDGLGRKQVYTQSGSDIYGISVFQDYLVWTDRQIRNGIHAGIKETGEKIRGIVHPGLGKAADVITYDDSQQPLSEGPCDGKIDCAQICLPGAGPREYTCACAMGFELGPDQKSCISQTVKSNFLVFTDTYQKQVYQMDLEDFSIRALALIDHDNPIAIDYDPTEEMVYWTDVGARVIKRSYLNGSQEQTVRQLDKNSIPDGIAVDSMSRLLYYTDTGHNVIAVMKLDGQYHKVIVNSDLDQPRAIVVDPYRGYVFWTDWGWRSGVDRIDMDGGGRRRVVNTGVGGWPNGLSIDIKEARLYWCDARSDKLESSDLNGGDRKVVLQSRAAHFFGVAKLGSFVYYTDWTKKTIMKINSTGDGSPIAIGPAVFSRLNGIHAYKHTTQIIGLSMNACSVQNGGCSHLCLPRPKGKTCACPDPLHVMPDQLNCEDEDRHALHSTQASILASDVVPTSDLSQIARQPALQPRGPARSASESGQAGPDTRFSNDSQSNFHGTQLIPSNGIYEQATTRLGVEPSRGLSGEALNPSSPTIPGVRLESTVHPTGKQPQDGRKPGQDHVDSYLETSASIPTAPTKDHVDIVIPIYTSTSYPPFAVPPIDNSNKNETLDEASLNQLSVTGGDSRLSAAALAGIVLGAVAALMLLVLVAGALVWHRRKRKNDSEEGGDQQPRAQDSPMAKRWNDTYDIPMRNGPRRDVPNRIQSVPDIKGGNDVDSGIDNPSFINGRGPDPYEDLIGDNNYNESISTFQAETSAM